MSLPVRLLPEARDEFDAATDWYEQQRPGLGADFVARVREVLQRISAMPGITRTRTRHRASATRFAMRSC